VLLKEWLPLARDENNWQTYIDNYFKTCRKTDLQNESETDNEDDKS
jgi:hypothetical protein